MTQNQNTTSYHQLTPEQRGQLQQYIEDHGGSDNINKSEIARHLGVHRTTITRELARNSVQLMFKDPKGFQHYYKRYEAETAETLAENRHHTESLDVHRFSSNYWRALTNAMRQKPRVDGVDGFTHAYEINHPDERIPATSTAYRYIDAGLLKDLRNIDLPKKTSRKVKANIAKPKGRNIKKLGTSISERDESVLSRETVGHWELDYVKGNREKHHPAVLVMTERKTRFELICKVPAYDSTTTLNYVQKLIKAHPELPFRSITCDNGSEFSQLRFLDTKVFYCHAYSSWERGTNEQTNGLLREYIPKGQPIETFSDQFMHEVEEALNNKHRKVLDYQTAKEAMANEAKIPA